MRAGLTNSVAGLGILVLLATSAVYAQHGLARVDLPVRVFDLSGQPEGQRPLALETAAAIMATADVQIVWKVCSAASGSGSGCDSPLSDTERVVRVQQTSPTWSRQEATPLGNSVVDGRSRSGVFATIYGDRVEWMASRAAVNPAVLLGRAMAHELGHLLFGASHSSAGIMRRCWTAKDLRWDSPGDWQFKREQVSLLGLR